MQGFFILAVIVTEKYTKVFYLCKILTKSMEHEMYVKGTGSRCVLVKHVTDN